MTSVLEHHRRSAVKKLSICNFEMHRLDFRVVTQIEEADPSLRVQG
jgi:hypothetical protein